MIELNRVKTYPLTPYARVSCFSFITFTSSPAGCKLQMLIVLGVKAFAVLCSRSGGDFRETFSAFG